MAKTVKRDVVIIGAGHAGSELASILRKKGFAGSILLIGDENAFPYERPPLSKACLLGKAAVENILLRAPTFWKEAQIELRLGTPVTAIDPEGRTIALADGRKIGFRWCVLATGGRTRRLTCPGSNLPGIHYLRNLADMERLRTDLSGAHRLAVVGGGYIGLEVAAAARELGKHATIIEAQPRVLSRVTSPAVSAFIEKAHHDRGVALRLGRSVEAIHGDGRVTAIGLDDGTQIAADLVVAGIGIDAETALAETAGIACHGGVLVDSSFRSSAPGILAIGDCSRHPNDYAGGLWRLESIQHAQDSAACAADTIMGHARIYHEVPTFWSEQYDLRLQSAGLCKNADETLLRGDPERGAFCTLYLQAGRVVAIDAINAPRDFMAARKLIASRACPDRVQLADSAVALRTLA